MRRAGKGRVRLWPERSQRGQMAVEMAVMVPVGIVVALVVYNLCRFSEACALFDRVALDAVVSQGVSPPGEQSALSASGAVRTCIEEALAAHSCEVSVAVTGAQAEAPGQGISFPVSPLLTTYTCTLRYRPWPHTFVLAGVPFRPPVVLTHERRLVVDRFRPGVVV